MLLFGLLAAERMKRQCLLAYPRAKFFAKKAPQRFSYAVATMKMPANSQIVSHILHRNSFCTALDTIDNFVFEDQLFVFED